MSENLRNTKVYALNLFDLEDPDKYLAYFSRLPVEIPAHGGRPIALGRFRANVTGDLVASKMIAPLDDLIKSRGQGFSRDAFYPEVLNAQTVDGRLYGVPRFVQTMLLYFNRDLFARAGLAEPNESWTWEKDFQDTATRLKSFMAGAIALRCGGDSTAASHCTAPG